MSPPPSAIAEKLYEAAQKAIKKNNFLEAEQALAQAISTDEQNPKYWNDLALVWITTGNKSGALDALSMAHSLDPENSRIMELLGDLYSDIANYPESALYYLKAQKKNKSDQKLHKKCAIALFKSGELPQALSLMYDLVIKYPDNKRHISDLTDMYRRFIHQSFDERAKQALTICLQEQHLKFSFLGASWSTLLLTDPSLQKLLAFSSRFDSDIPLNDIADQLDSKFLCQGLEKIPVTNGVLEIVLSNLRRYFLMHWNEHASWPKQTLSFLTSLAVQCWYNDFVFYRTPEEIKALPELTSFLQEHLETGQKELPDSFAALTALCSCYTPLYEIYKKDGKLPFGKSTLFKMKPLISAQLTFPRIEADLIPTIPSFTDIEDTTSKAVQIMYEKRPYPRWKSASLSGFGNDIAARSDGIEVLVAGCGTGQEPAIYANAMQNCRITAVDLSRTSIAYGKRMANEMGFLPRVNFLHGDLMKVGELNKRFDFIASSGVLHHLKEPDKGLSAILSTLKPGGRMSISLYSKAARDYALNPALTYIKEKGYSTSDDDIRQFRRDVLGMTEDNPVTRCLGASDFFSLAECNDLLFHVQEHRYTPRMIWDMAEKHNLVPFHTYLPPDKMKIFRDLFPDQALLDPDVLEKFEAEFPKAFIEMYKIYFRRKGEDAEHPLDSLINIGII